jgi:hypothetical protein
MNEEILFKLLKKIIPDLKTTTQYSFRDGYSHKYKLSLELKCRTKDYKEILIEKSKYDNLILCSNIRYINSMPSGIYSFNLKNIDEPLWFEKELPINTQFGNNKKIIKVVSLLDLSLANNITKLLL